LRAGLHAATGLNAAAMRWSATSDADANRRTSTGLNACAVRGSATGHERGAALDAATDGSSALSYWYVGLLFATAGTAGLNTSANGDAATGGRLMRRTAGVNPTANGGTSRGRTSSATGWRVRYRTRKIVIDIHVFSSYLRLGEEPRQLCSDRSPDRSNIRGWI
jgi:hypothetical protein